MDDIPGALTAAAPQIDGRREPRVAVSWRAMFRLPNGRVIETRVRDISESGLGLVCGDPVPTNTPIEIAVAVPDLVDVARSITIKGKVRCPYVVINGHDYRIGAQWAELDNASREMLKHHIKRQRYAGSP
jgi:hypothetical protein